MEAILVSVIITTLIFSFLLAAGRSIRKEPEELEEQSYSVSIDSEEKERDEQGEEKSSSKLCDIMKRVSKG